MATGKRELIDTGTDKRYVRGDQWLSTHFDSRVLDGT